MMEKGDLRKAELMFHSALRTSSLHSPYPQLTLLNLSSLYRRQGELSKAASMMEQARGMRKDQVHESILGALEKESGLLYEARDDIYNARQAYEQALHHYVQCALAAEMERGVVQDAQIESPSSSPPTSSSTASSSSSSPSHSSIPIALQANATSNSNNNNSNTQVIDTELISSVSHTSSSSTPAAQQYFHYLSEQCGVSYLLAMLEHRAGQLPHAERYYRDALVQIVDREEKCCG